MLPKFTGDISDINSFLIRMTAITFDAPKIPSLPFPNSTIGLGNGYYWTSLVYFDTLMIGSNFADFTDLSVIRENKWKF